MQRLNLKKFLRRFGTGVLVLTVCLLALLFMLTVPPGERVLKGVAEAQLRKIFSTQVQIGKVETNLVSRLVVRGVTVPSAAEIETAPSLFLGVARLDYSLLELLRGKLHIRTLTIDSMMVSGQRDSSSRLRLPLRGERPTRSRHGPSAPSPLRIQHLSLEHSSLRYQDRMLDVDASLYNLRVHASAAERLYNFALNIDSAVVYRGGVALSLWAIEVTGSGSAGGVHLEQVSMELPGLSLSGNLAIAADSLDAKLAGQFSLKGNPAEVSAILRRALAKSGGGVTGDMQLGVEIAGSTASPIVRISTELANVRYSEVRIPHAVINASWSPGTAVLDTLYMATLGGTVCGSGDVATDSLWKHHLNLKIEGVRLAEAWSAVYKRSSPFTGKISGTLFSIGEGARPADIDLRGDLELYEMKYDAQQIPAISSRIRFAKGYATFSFKQGDSEMLAEGRLKGEEIAAQFSASLLNITPLAELFNARECSGELKCSGSLSGSLRAPLANITADASIDFSDVAYQGHRLDYGEMRLSMAGRQLQLLSLDCVADSLLLHVTGHYAFSARGQAVARFQTLPLQGDATVKGERHYPRLSGGEEIGTVAVEFDFPTTGGGEMTARGEDLVIGRLAAFLPAFPDVGGRLTFSFASAGIESSLSGSPSVTVFPSVSELRFIIRQPHYRQVRFDSLAGCLRLAGGELTVSQVVLCSAGRCARGEAEIELERKGDGGYDFTTQSRFSGHLHAEEFDLQLLAPLLPAGGELSGLASFDISWNGTTSTPHPVATFSLRDGLYKKDAVSPAMSRVFVTATVRDSILTLHRLDGVVQDTPWYVTGQITGGKRGHYDADLEALISELARARVRGTVSSDSVAAVVSLDQFDLASIESFLPRMSGLAGTCAANLRLRGSFTDPEIKGNLEARGVGFRIDALHGGVERGVATITFDENTVRIDSLHFALNGGSCVISGELAHQSGGLSDVDVKVELDNVEVNRPNELLLLMKSARLHYSRHNSASLLDGDVILGESRLLYRFRPQSLLAFARSAERTEPELPALLKETRFDIRLRESENIWIDNNLARLRLHSELSFRGTFSQPNFSGRLRAEEGYILYLDRKFQVKKGLLDFIDPNRINPIIDLEAVATLKNYQTLENVPYTITFTINGPLDQTVTDLRSDPPLDKSDIVALLTVGATRQQLARRRGEGTVSSVSEVLKDRIAQLSSQRISGYASRRVGALLGLDQMSIDGNLFQFDRSWGPQLLASKKLSERMSITYSTTVGHLNEQSIRLDYRLSNYFSLQGQADQRGRSAIDVKYSLKFK